MPRPATLHLTPAQLRMVNSALARWEADDHDDDPRYRTSTMNGARQVIWEAMARLGMPEAADDPTHAYRWRT